MPRHLSLDLRWRIVYWRTDDGLQISEIAGLAGCSERTVYDILAQFRQFGEPANQLAQPRHRPRVLETSDVQYVVSLLQANPSLYLDELQHRLSIGREIDVSISTLSRTLRRISLSHKSVAREAAERNDLLRNTWWAECADIPKEYWVWLDEAGVDDLSNQRTAGWSLLGRACVRRALFFRGQRYSLLPAFTTQGIIALDLFEGSVNKERFLQFIHEQLVSWQVFSRICS